MPDEFRFLNIVELLYDDEELFQRIDRVFLMLANIEKIVYHDVGKAGVLLLSLKDILLIAQWDFVFDTHLGSEV